MATTEPHLASEVEVLGAPLCFACGQPMQYYGGSGGYICHDTKILVKAGGWFDESGSHLDDRRLNRESIADIQQHQPAQNE